MTVPGVKALIGEVAARHGITLRPDDPAFALVTINQLVLEHTIAALVRRVQEATAEFDQSANRIQERVGTVLAREMLKAGAEIRVGFRQEITDAMRGRQLAEQPRPRACRRIEHLWLSAGAVAALVLFIIGILIGRAWR